MKLPIFTILTIFTGIYGQSALAKPIECPEMFLSRLAGFNEHLRLEKAGMPGIFQEDFDYVSQTVRDTPEMVNCSESMGTPLTYSLNIHMNICTLPYAAQYMIDHGANVNQGDEILQYTPLYDAVEAYGSIYGNPEISELKNEDVCGKEVSEQTLKGFVQTLITHGADKNFETEIHESISTIASYYRVQSVLK